MTASRGKVGRSTLARAALAAAALAAAGCHPRQPVPLTREGEWAAVRDGATRRYILYDNFDHRATATATHLSLQVREARARRVAEWNGWTEQELQASLARERTEYAAGEEFLLAFFTADWRSTDLASPRSIWRIAVKVDGADVLASKVSTLEVNPNLTGLFPFIGPFDVVYRLFVPRPASGDLAGRPFVLELSSALGKMPLDYGAAPEQPVDRPWEPVPRTY